MLYTGNRFRLTPKTNKLNFIFDDLFIVGTGNAVVGFSGEGNQFLFSFSGNKIIDPDLRHVWSYNQYEVNSISGYIDSDKYSYYINNNLIFSQASKIDYNIEKLIINSTGCNFYSDISFYSPDIDYSLTFNDSFAAYDTLSGRLTNNSLYDFKVFGSSLSFYNEQTGLLTGNISGIVSGNSAIDIFLNDNISSRGDKEFDFLVTLNTSIGDISQKFSTNRISGLSSIVSLITAPISGYKFTGLFDGTGYSNRFEYSNSPKTKSILYTVSVYDLQGISQDKTVTFSFEPINPSHGSIYTGSYVTGITLIDSGEYLYPPTPEFTGYYSVTGLSTVLNSILLSDECAGNIVVEFSGQNGYGTNASGYLLTKKLLFNNVYETGLNYFYIVTGFSMIENGTGYTQQPIAIIKTGDYPGCYDVPTYYGESQLIFAPFNGNGILYPLAAYLTGEIQYQTGLVDGGSLTGYLVTGILITNPGFGYGNIYPPLVSFKRQDGDTLTSGASMTIHTSNTGYYDGFGHWSVSTGYQNSAFSVITGDSYPISGSVTLPSGENFLTVTINHSGKDNTQPLVTRLTTTLLSGGNTIISYFTGDKSYDITTGFLKKKNIIEYDPYRSSELSFLLTSEQLDIYYSSDYYLDNVWSVNIGDLDF